MRMVTHGLARAIQIADEERQRLTAILLQTTNEVVRSICRSQIFCLTALCDKLESELEKEMRPGEASSEDLR